MRAASRPMINHRGPEFATLIKEIVEGLRWALRTDADVLLFPGSGTGGLEAAAVNLLSPGETALFCTCGAFGERWADIAEAFGAAVVRLEVPWGEAIDPEDVERILAEHPDVTAVFVTHNETSTGVTNDLPAIAAVVKGRGKLLAVDTVSGAPCIPLDTDALGLDVVVAGSQKGWMAPPGLTMLAVGPGGFEAAARSRGPRWYWDLARQKQAQDRHQTATTPPLSVLYALQEGLAMLRDEGLGGVWDRHARVGEMVRAGVEAIGLKLLAVPGRRSDTVTAIRNPAGSADRLKELLSLLRTRYGVVLAGGQKHLQGEIFRIGHLGMIDERDVYAILGSLETAMADLSMLTRVGLTVPAAQAVFRRRGAGPRERPDGQGEGEHAAAGRGQGPLGTV